MATLVFTLEHYLRVDLIGSPDFQMTVVTPKRREEKGIFVSKTSPEHDFNTSARHDD